MAVSGAPWESESKVNKTPPGGGGKQNQNQKSNKTPKGGIGGHSALFSEYKHG